ncbi:SusD/RagB family nutrient-binding outer membrane lipoprotein [Lacinutrix sp. C3R15]|uniref:SusD/RagB family nutrient-binding outer membrane lipoprotein n=1 Tax=Flavobacteriaceae TaxID=49546 RepID=UPI001C0890EB|nr:MULTISPECIES: SusD/RagB family nutrient-binding outer membrane lipoprotein [Flavobacteriaceae]MBU2939368.1 SusD/RagB family nutrient-binding outer membrane lipoprotein [Lacinutrix sp. C3R15]MDO6622683.1 SusD/RagB family nutrient-binding outer membrane lipoprotein [Oceanihabitans sp. 1_MG-2023]
MKKIKYLLALVILGQALTFTSCDGDFEETNTDPNNPVSVPSELLLAGITRSAGDRVQDIFLAGEAGSCWAQHLGKPVYNTNELYVPRTASIETLWTVLYSSVIKDAVVMQELAEEEGNSNLQGVALVMQAYAYQLLTDTFGDIPMSEASQGDSGLITPKYDDSETEVYPAIISMLTEANTLLNGNGSIDASQDLIYGGDYSKWKKFANSLKFRVLMRASSGGYDAAGELQALVNAGNMFTSNDDEAKLVYLSASPNANPYFEGLVDGGRVNEWCLGEELVNYMTATSDPRLPVYAQEVGGNGSGNGYVGKPAGIQAIGDSFYGDSNNVSLIGEKYLEAEEPAYLLTFAQLNFLMAEAAEKGYISGSAADYFAAGIAASCASNGVGALSISYSGGAAGLQQIAEQSWVSLYLQGFEAWTEYRRTGFPDLPLAIDAQESSIPSRLTYPISQQSVNGVNYSEAVSSQGADVLTTPLWWTN